MFDPVISDHYGLRAELNIHYGSKNNYQFRSIREMSQWNLDSFVYSLENTDWSVIEVNDVDEAWTMFLDCFLYFFDLHCPERKIRESIDNKKPWITDKIRESSRMLKDLYRELINSDTNTNDLQNSYRTMKKDYRIELQKAKHDYYNAKITNAGNRTKEIWKFVNLELNRKKSTGQIQLNGNTSARDAAHTFAKQFSSSAKNKINQQYGTKSMDRTYTSKIANSLYLENIQVRDILNTIASLKDSYSAGSDGINSKILKQVQHAISEPLARLANMCISEGKYPTILKTARVTPVYKRGDPQNPENYRPISVISVFSKILEKLLHSKINNFLERYNILNKCQHGFRHQHSTETAAIDLTEFIYRELDNGHRVAAIFFDLSSAFDTLDITIVENKLYAMGIRGKPLDIITSFLSERQLYVTLDWAESDMFSVDLGVPQGSVLGPLLFICFMNDLSESISDGHLINFADDTTVAISAATECELENRLERCQREFGEWCAKNRLLLNLEKTVTMRFRLRTPGDQCDMGPKPISFLGLTVDANLSWKNQIDRVVKKLNSAYYAILKLKHTLRSNGLLQMYYSLVFPILKYNVVIWGQGTHSERVFIAQKRILRLIFGVSPRDSCRPVFIANGLLTFVSIYIYSCSLYIFNNPGVRNCAYHHYNTRNGNEFRVPVHNTSKYEKSVKYAAIKVFNALPQNIKSIGTLNKFKKDLKDYLATNCFYSLCEYFNL